MTTRWVPVWPLSTALEMTADWYRRCHEDGEIRTRYQLARFVEAAQAAGYPNRPLTSVGSFAPGTGADIAVRFYAEKLSGVIGKPVTVDLTLPTLVPAQASPVQHAGRSTAPHVALFQARGPPTA